MYSNLCPFTLGLHNLNFEKLFTLAAENGFGGLDFLPDSFSSVEQAREAGQKVVKAGMRWGLFPLPCDFLLVDDQTFQEGLQKLENILPLVKAAGCTRAYNHVWPGNDVRPYQENFKWHVHRLTELVDLLSSFDVRLGIEFIGPKTLRDTFTYPFIHTLGQARELADAVSPKLGLIVDFFHWYTSGSTLADIKAIADGDRIVNVHANDAFPGRQQEEQQDLERQLPLASGLIDAAGIMKTLRELRYDGPVICEPFFPTLDRFKAMPHERVIQETAQVMQKLFAEV